MSDPPTARGANVLARPRPVLLPPSLGPATASIHSEEGESRAIGGNERGRGTTRKNTSARSEGARKALGSDETVAAMILFVFPSTRRISITREGRAPLLCAVSVPHRPRRRLGTRG